MIKKIAFVGTTFDSTDIKYNQGNGYYLTHFLKKKGIEIEWYSPSSEPYKYINKAKEILIKQFTGKKYLRHREISTIRKQTSEISNKLQLSDADIVFSFGSLPVAYLNTEKPIYFITDAAFHSLIDYYEEYSKLTFATIRNGIEIDKTAFARAKGVFFNSEWARQAAIDICESQYQNKFYIAPLGDKFEFSLTNEEVQKFVNSKRLEKLRFFFMGIDWDRKGGDIAVEVIDKLNQSGIPSELLVAGIKEKLPENGFIKNLGYLSKNNQVQLNQLKSIFETIHFFILPSKAETFGHVFCEANMYGVPALATKTGGIPDVIHDNKNGFTFALDASPDEYVDKIKEIVSNPQYYFQLALSSRREYNNRLNWDYSISKMLDIINADFAK